MLIAERENQSVVGGVCLELKIEGPAEAFPERQPPRASDSRPEGSVQDKLHASALIEESLGNHGPDRRQRTQFRGTRADISCDLCRTGLIESAIGDEERGHSFR